MRRAACLLGVGLFGLGSVLASAGCAPRAVSSACAAGMGAPVLVYTLYFGEQIPGRGDLTDAEWRGFLDDTITPNLPNGYTVWDAKGAWMNPMTHRTIREPTKVLTVALPVDQAGLAAVNRIRSAYQVAFRQQLVGMTSAPACGSF